MRGGAEVVAVSRPGLGVVLEREGRIAGINPGPPVYGRPLLPLVLLCLAPRPKGPGPLFSRPVLGILTS